MKKERLFRILGEIDEDLIDSAENKRSVKPKTTVFRRYGALAACAVLVIGIGIAMYQRTVTPPDIDTQPTGDNDSKLPMLTINTDFAGGMGFEGYCAYNIDELTDENPWSEDSKITHLPVIKNVLTYNDMQRVEEPDIESMKELLKITASRLGMDINNLSISDDMPDDETKKQITEKLTMFGGKVPEGYFDVSRVFMEDKNIKVEVDTSMEATVHFEPAVSLPKEFNFTHNASYNDVYKVAEYLNEQYKDYIDMENPKINIEGGDYTFSGKQGYQIKFFDDIGNKVEKILNYNFNYVTFACNDEGKLFISRIYKPDLTDVIGNYPIISKEKALKLLENRNYITTVPEEFPGMQYIRKIELIYRNGSMEKIYMPYYRIYVELPSMKLDNGLNTYGAYYVPAVEKKYIENMPMWNGEFN